MTQTTPQDSTWVQGAIHLLAHGGNPPRVSLALRKFLEAQQWGNRASVSLLQEILKFSPTFFKEERQVVF